MKNLIKILSLTLLCLSTALQAQVTNNGLPLGISANTIVSYSGGDISSTGDVTNDGELFVGQNLDISGVYAGNGAIQLNGTSQTFFVNGAVASLSISGGNKTLAGSMIVNDLNFNNARLLTSTFDLEVSGTITGADATSHVVGPLIRSGATTLDFPISDGAAYTPVTLSSISGTSPSISVEIIDTDPNGIPGNGLLGISDLRYWDIREVSGVFTDAVVELPVVNEMVAATITELAVARGTTTGATFRGLGQSANSGDIVSGTLTAATPAGPGLYAIGRFFDENLRIADSVALVQIYQSTTGAEWTQSTNWLAADMDSWFGVSVSEKRVQALALPTNNLTGSIPEITSGLENTATIDFSGNELTDVGPVTNLVSLTSLDVSDNRLQFGVLESLITDVPALVYAPQKEVLSRLRTLEEVNTTYTMDRTLTGSANTYAWTKDGSAISETTATFDIEINDFSVDGSYVATVTNSNLPDLTLVTAPVILRVSSRERDQASLREVYLALNADQTNVSDWINLPIEEWNEVSLDGNNRVTDLDLSGFGLTGSIPEDILDVEGLITADFSDNEIEGLPVTTGSLPNLDVLNVEQNKLDFGDLEPLIDDFVRVSYQNQKPFGQPLNTQVDQGTDYTLTASVGGSANTYQWYRNDVFTGGQEANYVISNIGRQNMGNYVAEVRSSIIDDLVLTSEVQTVLAQADITMTPIYEDIDGLDAALSSGDATGELYRITPTGRYQATDTVEISNNQILFENKVLDDYVLFVRPTDTLLIKINEGRNDSVKLLPTYYERTIDWVEATPIELNADFVDSLFMEQQPRQLTEADGDAVLNMLVESDFADDTEEGSRIDARRRVKKAGCSLRRRVTGGGRADQDGDFELIAYKETDDDGNVSFGFLPAGEYRINIQYPGVPMDPDSYTEFVIEEGAEGVEFNLEATITDEAIVVELIEALGFYREYFKNLDVFPNPADQFVTIRYDKLMSDNVKVKLLNMNGKVVREASVQKGYALSQEMDVSDVEGGIYLLYFYDPAQPGQNISIFKVIVRH